MRIGIDKIIGYLLLFKRTWNVYEISLKTFQVNLSTKQFISLWHRCGNRGRHDSRFGWLPVTTGYQNLGLSVRIDLHTQAGQFFTQIGYRLHWLPGFWSQLPSVTSLPHFSRLPVTKKSKFFW